MSVESYLKPDVIKRVSGLDLKARFLMEGFLSGLHSSPFKGFSVEFSEHRKYVPGDDVRTIDWKVYARTNRYYVKQFQAETNMQGHLLVDTSASMAYAGGKVTKLEYATYLAAALSYLMIKQQDPVGLTTFSDRIQQGLRPRATRGHLLRILKMLSETTPRGRTAIAPVLHEIAERLKKRGLVILFSDLLDDPDAVGDALHHFRYRGHDLIVFHILDAHETRFPFDGSVRFEDMETGESVVSDARAIRAAYLDQMHAFTEKHRAKAIDDNIDYVLIDTATPFDVALTAYLVKRAGR